MSSQVLDILLEDNHCLAVAKPAGIPSTHFSGKEPTMDRLVKEYLKDKYQKPGNVFLGIVHRLDKPVSGVLLFARTSKAAARLAEQFRKGEIGKVYWCVVEGKVAAKAGDLEDWLRKDEARGKMQVVQRETHGARQARLRFQRLASHGGLSFLEVRPQTGRRHQLRVQLAHYGHPIVGDSKYGSRRRFAGGIALHARALTFSHPIGQAPVTLTAQVPDSWNSFGPLLSGILK
jgi:23S rRNA pseudouridine1911/1915/1917 synthase